MEIIFISFYVVALHVKRYGIVDTEISNSNNILPNTKFIFNPFISSKLFINVGINFTNTVDEKYANIKNFDVGKHKFSYFLIARKFFDRNSLYS